MQPTPPAGFTESVMARVRAETRRSRHAAGTVARQQLGLELRLIDIHIEDILADQNEG